MTTPSRSRSQGFTLIELLVVMAIIATLAGLGMVGIPAILRQKDKIAAKDRLASIYKMLTIYHTDHKKWPKANGAGFCLAIWESKIVDHTMKDAEIFFDPSLEGGPDAEFTNMSEEGIDWTGPANAKIYRPSMRNANAKVIVCNKIPLVQDEEDLDLFPHAAKGLVYLTAGGATEWMDAGEWSEDWPVIGEESSVEMFRPMQVYEIQ
ncbi:MAG: hypothetical protein CMJ83_05530 [Planctomycetes bacterium]|nr:hypothetical protein [Planctomycetota bacterium]